MIVCGKDIVIGGGLVRIAHIDGDKYNFPDDPEMLLDGLRKAGDRIDLFTFLQKLRKRPRNMFIPWSGTIWQFCLSLLLINGGTIKSGRFLETVRARP